MNRSRLRVHLRALSSQARELHRNPSNRGHRIERWVTVVRYESNALLGRPTWVSFANGAYVRVTKGGNSSSRAAFARLPDWPEMAVWQHWLRPGDLFLDVGANVGLYSLVAHEAGATVVAAEPADDMADALEANLRKNAFERVVVRRAAIMVHVGYVGLAGPDANRRRVVSGPAELQVSATTLEELAGGVHPRGLKIDVEGHELSVVQGGATVLGEGGVDLIQLEWNSASIEATGETRTPLAGRLRDLGFLLFEKEPTGRYAVNDTPDGPRFGSDVFAARGGAIDFLYQAPWLDAVGGGVGEHLLVLAASAPDC